MDQQLKERLVGIIVLVLFAVIFIPMFFSEPIDLVSKEKTNLSNSKESEFVSKLKPVDDSTQELDTKRIEYRLEKSKQLPKLSGFISGTYTGYNNEFDFTNKAQNWFGSSVFGVKFELPLTNANKLNVSSQKAKIAMDQAATNLEEQKEKTRAEVQQKLNDYQLAVQSLNVNEKNMRLSMSIEEKNSIKFFEGLVTSFELRQAQLQLLDSQQKYLNSVLEIISVKTELETLYNN